MRKKKKRDKKIYIGMVSCMLLGVIMGLTLGDALIVGTGSGSLLITLLLAYIAMTLHVIIHEAGHLVFGTLSGYKFISFRIFSFIWLKVDGKMRVKRYTLAGTSGQCLMAPPDLKDGKMPVLLFNFGGSLMNLLVSLFSLVIFYLTNWKIILLFAVIGLLTAFINGIPLRVGLIDNDGKNAISLQKNPKAIRAFWVELKVGEMQAKGKRLKDMPEEWFQMPDDSDLKNSTIVTTAVYACNRLMDELRFEEAEAEMRRLLAMDSGIAGIHKNLMICDLIYCELISKNRLDVIEEYNSDVLKQFMKQMKTFPSVIRTEYAYALLCERNKEKAQKHLAYFEKTEKNYPYPQDMQSERELMQIADKVHEERNTNTVVIRKIVD